MGPRCGRTSKTNMGRTSFKWRAVAAPDFTAIMRATVCATIMGRTVVLITAITGRITDRTTTRRTVTGRNQPELDCDGISAERRMSANGASDPLPSVPAKVGLLNRQPTFGLGDGDYSSCPTSALRPP